MLILAFDTVPHQSRINKMEHYGIKSNIHRWVSSWLTQRHQRVCVDEEESSNKPVRSGIPQGTVLGPLCFLIYINNMEKSISRTSTLCLFADDSLLYRPGNTTDDGKRLQEDLTELTKWVENGKWHFILQNVTSSEKEKSNHHQLWNAGATTGNCTSISLSRSRTIRRSTMGATYQQGHLKSQQNIRILETEHLQRYLSPSLHIPSTSAPWICFIRLRPIYKVSHQRIRNGTKESCQICHVQLHQRARNCNYHPTKPWLADTGKQEKNG